MANHAISKFDNLKFSVSFTTRKIRQNEVYGVDYKFITKDEFNSMLDSNKFAEWAEVHGNYYGTPIENVKDSISKGIDVLLDIDVQGASQLKGKFSNAIFIFVVPPSIELLENRLKKRNSDKKEDISLRMNVVKDEIRQSQKYDYIIINDDIESAKRAILSIIISERNEKNSQKLINESLEISKELKSEKIFYNEVVDRFNLG